MQPSRDGCPASPAGQAPGSGGGGGPHPAYHNHGSHSHTHGAYGHAHAHAHAHPAYQRSPLASPSTYQYGSAYGGPSGSSHPSPAAHQLQHPDHSANSASASQGGGRASPYSSPRPNPYSYRTALQRSNPELSHAPPFQQQHLATYASSSSMGVLPPPDSPLVNVADLSEASHTENSGGKQSKPRAKKRKKAAEEPPASRETSVDIARTGASSDGKDSKATGRVAKACQPCSTKKRRCDGRQPECSVCQVLGSVCTYNHTGLRRGPPKGFRSGPKESAKAKLVRSLETTVRDLISHLGKEEAGSEILRVTANRELGLSKEDAEADKGQTGAQAGAEGAAADSSSTAAAAVKEEAREVKFAASRARGAAGARGGGGGGGDGVESSEASDEDVIGDTQMGEQVYRGSSSGIGILQRQQHRAESPAPAQQQGNPGSASSALVVARSKLESSNQWMGGRKTNYNLQGQPVFVPIASPRTAGSHQSGGGDTPPSSHARSPTLLRKDSSPKHAGQHDPSKSLKEQQQQQLVGSVAPVNPIVSDDEHARLFRYYWQGFHPFWPILYKPYMTGIPVEQLRQELEPCLLYSIYAIAACIVPGPANRNAASSDDDHKRVAHDHQRAQLFSETAERHLFLKGMRPDIPTIQSCWLLCLYSHGTGDLSRAWNFQNLASSMAVDLGLHRWPIYRSEIIDDPLRRETRIRLIWHCYIMDKVLCAEMGRPVGLRAKDCDVPLLSETAEDELDLWVDQTEMQSDNDGRQQPATAERASEEAPRHLHAPSCLNWGIHLFQIVERILDEVHSLRRKTLLRKQGKGKVMAELDKELTDWQAKLPKHLHLDQETRDGPLPSFFALNLWHYTARLLLHRPFIPQEEGLSLSEVIANDSHRKSTEAANTICDLLEQSSTDFVDRLSTDLGYCLFTAAVMFVFNARLPDAKISSDARRRYGLCRKWLKKLADTWPAASAQKLLLDSFALVGEDASKATKTPARRPLIAALGMLQHQQQQQQMAAQQGGGAVAPAGSTASAWIAETDATTKAQASAGEDKVMPREPAATPARPSHGQQPPAAQPIQGQTSDAPVPQSTALPSESQFAFGLPGAPAQQQQQQGFNAADLNFAPGIFDVESFFWNENIAMNAPFVQQTTGAYQYPAGANPQQQQQQQQFDGFFGNGAAQPQQGRGGDPASSSQQNGARQQAPHSQPTDGLSMLAQVTSSTQLGQCRLPPGGFEEERGNDNASALPYPAFFNGNVRPGQAVPPRQQQGGVAGGQTSIAPFVYPLDPSNSTNNTSMGEF